jgi:pseudouridine kinase
MDINGFSAAPINMADSNPGRIEYCPGGVGRNIAENLHRLGAEVHLISVIGNDPGGQMIRAASEKLGLDIGHSLFLSGEVSSVYLAIMDSNGEMKLALADMSLPERMTAEHLESKAGLIAGSAVVALDANLPEDIIRFVLDRFGPDQNPGADGAGALPGSGNVPGVARVPGAAGGIRGGKNGRGPLFFLDPVSARKAVRAKGVIGGFDTLKLNRMEGECLSGIPLPSPETSGSGELAVSLDRAGSYFIDRGVRRVFITLGKAGVYFCSGGKRFFTANRQVKPVNTSGGGDAFMAGMIYGTLRGLSDEETAAFAGAMAAITVQSAGAVSPGMSLALVEEFLAKERL